ncbi:hypothetical protein C1646_773072 [Rhizophagus diaphanus]|nr:hypothetical protein C1646_773072 [Rhizophagus diaphanus] [Rhizophagus sp. MUCL 43196]
MDNENFNESPISDVINDYNETTLFNENEHALLYPKKKFTSWDDRVYESNSTKDTSTNKISCPFLVNASCPKSKNDENLVFINKINDQYNHPLSTSSIIFEESKKFTFLMIDDIKFMTTSCKFGVTVQRKFLEGKYPSHPIYSKDLYVTIQSFHPTIAARGWDNDNTLTHLLWMIPTQVENWIQYTDCVLNDVTHKTNRYGMALSLFVRFDNNRHNILLAQALSANESIESDV